MNGRRHQSGMSILGILTIMIMVGFFVMCGIRMAPPYLEYLSVRDIVSRIAMEPDTPELSARQIRRRIENIFNTNQIYELDPRKIEIYRTKGKTYIDATYEVRLPVMWKIEAILNFNDLLFEVGKPKALPPGTEIKK